MNSQFTMKYRESNSDLHVSVAGDFHVEAARELVEVLERNYSGTGRVFLDVRQMETLGEGEVQLFRQCLEGLPAERLLFKGELGFRLGRNGCRVLIVKKKACQCSGACAVCSCALRAQKGAQAAKGRCPER